MQEKTKEIGSYSHFLFITQMAVQHFTAAFQSSPFVQPVDRRIISALESGRSAKEIAEQGRMSVSTVRHRITRITHMHEAFIFVTKSGLTKEF